jgi:N-acyl-D-amino-acid deacylase
MRIFAALLALLTLSLTLAVQTPSILISGGTLVDGTGAKSRRADVRIVDHRIAEVGRLKPKPGERVINAQGLIVAPGFIDTHSHADGRIFDEPEAESQIRQGITTAIVGQDGGGRLPLADFFSRLDEKHPALDFASFVGHGAVRRQVMGADYKRPATADEIAKMVEIVEREMKAGALGLSSGLEYDPGYYSTTEELIACARVAAKHGGIYISHVRDEANKSMESFREVVRIAREAKIPAQISHIKLGSTNVWGRADEVLQLLAEANREGLDVSADVYPYLYWQSTITVLIPTRNWDDRAAWEKGLAEVGGAKNVLLGNYSLDANWQGKTIAEISQLTGKDAVTVIQEIVRKTHGEGATGRESVIVTSMVEEDLQKFIRAPRTMFCSDGAIRGAHPRGAGTFPRILGRYVREQKLVSLEEAIRKMTSLPSQRMGFKDRGVIKEGMKADLAIFDAQKIIDRATTSEPTAAPEGMEYVLVNGALVLDGGKMTAARSGRALKRN